MLRQFLACSLALVVLLCCLQPAVGAARPVHILRDVPEKTGLDNEPGRNLLQLGGFLDGILGGEAPGEEPEPTPPAGSASPAAAIEPDVADPLVTPAAVAPVAPVAVAPAPVATPPATAPVPVVAPAPAPIAPVSSPPVAVPAPAPVAPAPAPTAPAPIAPAPVAPAPAPIAPAPAAPVPAPVVEAPEPVEMPEPVEAPPPLPVEAPPPPPPPVVPEPPTDPDPPPPTRPPREERPVDTSPPPDTDSTNTEDGANTNAENASEDEDGGISNGIIVAIVAGVLVVMVVAVVAVLFGGRGCGSSRPPPPPPIMDTPLQSPNAYYGGNTDAVYGATGAQGTKYFVPPGQGATPQYSNVGLNAYAPPAGYGPEPDYGQGGSQNGAQGGYQNAAPGGYQNGAQGGYQKDAQGYQNGAQGGYQNDAQGYQNGAQGGYQNDAQGYQNGAQGGYQSDAQQHQALPPDHPANPMFDHQLKNGEQHPLASTPSDVYASPASGYGGAAVAAGAVGVAAVGAASRKGKQDPLRSSLTKSYDALADAAAPAMAAAAADAQKKPRHSSTSKPSRASSYASANPDGQVSPAGAGGGTTPPRRQAGAMEPQSATSDTEANYYANIAFPVEESAYSPYNSPPSGSNESSAHQSLFFMEGGTPPGQAPGVVREDDRREEAQDFLTQHEAKHVTVVPGEAGQVAGESGQTLLKTLSKTARSAGYIPEGPGSALVKQLDWIEAHKKGLLLGKYKLQGAAQRRSGGQGMVAFASDPYTNAMYAVKFYFSATSFQREKSAITHPALERAMPACADIVDSEYERRLPSPQGILPLMIVTEKGECLSEYMKRKHPDYVTSMQVIVQIAEKLRTMHNAGWAHRDLKPGNTIWLPSRNTWSLIDFGCAGKIGSKVPISFTLRYAAPETVAAFQRGKSTNTADTAVDVFAFGIMCYELLTREPYYPSGVNGQEVGEMLAGNKQLPHEEMSEINAKRLGVLRQTVLKMLDRAPETRSSISDLLRFCSNVFQVNNNSTTQT